MKQTDSAFESWYNGMVGFHINSERILEDLNFPIDYGYVDPKTVRKWMAVCWNNALDAAQNSLMGYDYYYDNGNKWNDDCYSSIDLEAKIEELKENI